MALFGLIGHPVGHSFSKELFDRRFEGRHGYRLIDLESVEGLREKVRELGLEGFNVTIPHKRAVAEVVDRLTEVAETVGAVNCVRVEKDGSLIGENTDAEAFRGELEGFAGRRRALILGTGGAAQAVGYALKRSGVEYEMVSRRPGNGTISYEEAYERAEEVGMIVNATPVGMRPNEAETPWGRPELLTERHWVYDLVYNPSPTRLMREAAAKGAKVKDGMGMLRRQAELSWEFWGI
ncbi:MAG: shikimate dehydrogenase [Bacteroidales bacterium]|nr:shikimate dehydrogenase [Bacteroidales bacterium]